MNSSMSQSSVGKQVTVIVIGAGNRGKTYSQYALDFPDSLKVRKTCIL